MCSSLSSEDCLDHGPNHLLVACSAGLGFLVGSGWCGLSLCLALSVVAALPARWDCCVAGERSRKRLRSWIRSFFSLPICGNRITSNCIVCFLAGASLKAKSLRVGFVFGLTVMVTCSGSSRSHIWASWIVVLGRGVLLGTVRCVASLVTVSVGSPWAPSAAEVSGFSFESALGAYPLDPLEDWRLDP